MVAISAPIGVRAEAGREPADWRQDGVGFEDVEDPAGDLFTLPEPLSALAAVEGGLEARLDTVLSVVHDVPVEEGETLRVREFFTLRSWLRWPKRAVLFLTTTSVTADLWDIPVEGYNGPEMAARRGMFAFTVDYLGVGENYRPGGNALDSTFERNLAALQIVVRYVRFFRAVPRVDLVGESWGGALATQMAADSRRIRTCVMASMTYKEIANPQFIAPEFVAYLKTLEDNYIPSDPNLIAAIAVGAPDEVKAYILRTQTGPRLTTQLWQFIAGLPHFDPSVAKVPGLVISSDAEAGDGRTLAADYGPDGAEFFEIAAGGHAPRLSSPVKAEAFWTRVFDFIDHGQNSAD